MALQHSSWRFFEVCEHVYGKLAIKESRKGHLERLQKTKHIQGNRTKSEKEISLLRPMNVGH